MGRTYRMGEGGMNEPVFPGPTEAFKS
ncbi:hypothetical protein LCGC14_2484650, partial [marine sediment metagenome]